MNTDQKTVGQIAVEFPDSINLFDKLQIDYCCEGHRSLQDVCSEAGIEVDAITSAAELSKRANLSYDKFSMLPLKDLINYIIEQHHLHTKLELHRLRLLIARVCNVHRIRHPELIHLKSRLQELTAELEPHMLKEECVLFPYVVRMEMAVENHRNMSAPAFRTVNNPVKMLTLEHEDAGYLLRQMRRITSNYSVPEDACEDVACLYDSLDKFDRDLRQHIHLENNILFPRAQEMEVGLLS